MNILRSNERRIHGIRLFQRGAALLGDHPTGKGVTFTLRNRRFPEGSIFEMVDQLVGKTIDITTVAKIDRNLIVRKIVIGNNRQLCFKTAAAIGQVIFTLQEDNCFTDPAHTGCIVCLAADTAPTADGIDKIQFRSGVLQPISEHAASGPAAAQIVCKVHQRIELLLAGLAGNGSAVIVDDFAVFLGNLDQKHLLRIFPGHGHTGLIAPAVTAGGTVTDGPLVHVPIRIGGKTFYILDHIQHILTDKHLAVAFAFRKRAKTDLTLLCMDLCRRKSEEDQKNQRNADQTFCHNRSPSQSTSHNRRYNYNKL